MSIKLQSDSLQSSVIVWCEDQENTNTYGIYFINFLVCIVPDKNRVTIHMYISQLAPYLEQ